MITVQTCLTPPDSTPKVREQSIQLPKVKGHCITVLLDFPELTDSQLDYLTTLVAQSFPIFIVGQGQEPIRFEAAYNTEKKYFLYGRYENEVVLYTIRLNIFEPVSVDYLSSLRGEKFIIKI